MKIVVRRPKTLVLLVAVLAGLSLVPAPAHGSAYDDYDQVNKKLNEARKNLEEAKRKESALRKSIAKTDAERRDVEQDLGALQASLNVSQARLNVAEAELGGIQQQMADKSAQLEATLAELDRANKALRARAATVYKMGPATLFDFVLGAADFSDLVDRLQFVMHVFMSDEARLRTMGETKERVLVEREQLAQLRQQAAAQVAVVQRERDSVLRLRGALESRRRQLQTQLKSQYATLEDVQADKETWLRQARELERESARIAAFLRSRNGGKATVGKGGMVWPTRGKVSSGFGWRTHPIFGTKKFHAGIDIAAPSGQAVVAAAAGEVIFAGQKGGYGNAVIVDHGGGLATVYAHLSSFGAGNGANLARGQTLGRVGCTGYCTGPHLHFEVRVGGEPRDPMQWLG